MHIVVPVTAIKADEKTRLEFKGVHSQLDALTVPKMMCIEFPGKKMILFRQRWFSLCAVTTC
jgi:hypothetical protein